jgi:uncharacterized protein (TIGR02145 family)
MKKILLLIMCIPAILSAQTGNGVTVGNLVVNTGSPSTVTFDVSWQTPMPVEVWSDTVWVFVDHNDNGTMKRLPLSSGATLTATHVGVGRVEQLAGNNTGVRVIGNARTNGSFSATVQLLTATTNVAGACVYASNYPPVAEYREGKIFFTGTPGYKIVFKATGGATFDGTSDGTYTIQAGETIDTFTDKTGAPGIISDCTPPNATVNFTAFNPCVGAATYSVWHLADTRETGNSQTYTVKLMNDGRYWMIQDMKFGDKCKLNSFSSSSSNTTGKVTSLSGTWYGNCTAATNTSTPAARGYLYDWAAAINKADAYYGSSSNVGCSGTATGTSGTAPGACQGVCPVGWHIPTGTSIGEFQVLHNAGGCSTGNDDCWDPGSAWTGVLGGRCESDGSLTAQGSNICYWTSSYAHTSNALTLTTSGGTLYPGTASRAKSFGYTVRCVRNY